MPETTDSAAALTPAQLTDALTALTHGPYADTDTDTAAGLTAETIRYLNYAAPRGGITEPGTVAGVAAHLATAAYRMPQLLTQLAEWLAAETAEGRIADDHGRPAWQLAEAARALFWEATEHAEHLASALNAARNVTATLHAAAPGSPAA
jgi:hypothetical protein